MESNKLPLIRAAPDSLRTGWHKASEDVRPVHPVQQLQAAARVNEWNSKMITVEQIYGKAAAMRLRTERTLLEQYHRLPGLPSSHAGVDTLLGVDEQLGFDDILNNPFEDPEREFKVHEAMEVKFGIF